MKRVTSHRPRTLILEATTLRRLTGDELKLAVGGLASEMTCADQGCERRRM